MIYSPLCISHSISVYGKLISPNSKLRLKGICREVFESWSENGYRTVTMTFIARYVDTFD